MIKVYVTHTSRTSTVFVLTNGKKVYTRGNREYFIVHDTIKAMELPMEYYYNDEPSSDHAISFYLVN